MTISSISLQAERYHPQQAAEIARKLGELLLLMSEYQVFMAALKMVNNDSGVQILLTEIRSHNNALRWSPKNADEHESALHHLENELEAMPVILEYHLVEEAVCKIFNEVDAIISEAAGVPFAVNARRSGCGCGS